MRILGFIFVSLLLSVSIIIVDLYTAGTYLSTFLDEHFIETFAALVGFNIAAVIFLVGQLLVMEERFKTVFNGTRTEIKHNSYFLLSAFVATLLVLIFRPDYVEGAVSSVNIWFYVANMFVIGIFILAIFAIYEILHAVFELSKKSTTT